MIVPISFTINAKFEIAFAVLKSSFAACPSAAASRYNTRARAELCDAKGRIAARTAMIHMKSNDDAIPIERVGCELMCQETVTSKCAEIEIRFRVFAV